MLGVGRSSVTGWPHRSFGEPLMLPFPQAREGRATSAWQPGFWLRSRVLRRADHNCLTASLAEAMVLALAGSSPGKCRFGRNSEFAKRREKGSRWKECRCPALDGGSCK